MVAPLALVRNAEGAQSEGRARHVGENRRGQGQYRGRSPVGSGQSAARGSIKAGAPRTPAHSPRVLFV